MATLPTLPPHIAQEAFMLLDQFDEQRGPNRRPARPGQVPPRERKPMDSLQAARLFNGVMICEHYAKKPSYGKAY